MTRPDDEVEELEGRPASRLSLPVVTVAVVIVAALVLLGIAAHKPHARSPHPVASSSPMSTQLPQPVAIRPPPERGSVFIEHLDRCTRTDHRSHVTVAVAVTNMSNRRLRLVGAAPLDLGPSLRLTDVRVGGPPCATTGSGARSLDPSQEAVVALSFAVGPGCSTGDGVATRISFNLGAHQMLHADSSELAILGGLGFAHCAPD